MMRRARRHASRPPLVGGWLALGLAVLTFAGPTASGAGAREITQAERAALARSVETFTDDMRARRTERVVAVIPPRVLAHIAGQAGLDVERLRKIIVEKMDEAMKVVAIDAFALELAAAKDHELADGTPYVLIPTSLTMDAGTGKISTRSNTLAMLDGGTWYLLDVNQAPQLAIFIQVYPEFAGVEFGGKTSKVVPR